MREESPCGSGGMLSVTGRLVRQVTSGRLQQVTKGSNRPVADAGDRPYRPKAERQLRWYIDIEPNSRDLPDGLVILVLQV